MNCLQVIVESRVPDAAILSNPEGIRPYVQRTRS
jgi:hypothetical protein